jgi:hypothetical protein
VDIFKEATYEIWVAGRVPGRSGVSPVQWSVDSYPPALVAAAKPVGDDYAPGLCWYSLGRVTLQRGHHVLTLAVPNRAGGDKDRYQFGIDAIVLARAPFQPHGTEPPAWSPARSETHVAARP